MALPLRVWRPTSDPASGLVPTLAAFTAPRHLPSIYKGPLALPSTRRRTSSSSTPLPGFRIPFFAGPAASCAWTFSLMHCPFHYVGDAVLSGRPRGRNTDVIPDPVFYRIGCA
ncbi:hypothetical protein N7478_010011 [Penicillium angulare]|uniref:uncharacterized protein n=1 Tax=Penicillium angulare TaxID=116970 RepID=UPI002541DC71|nr:uncharacterized protein N7478_010011 [Penicillium angulare]KAJ5267203.1 hypothetical protein N7478_010011 [Penicillium angulare]